MGHKGCLLGLRTWQTACALALFLAASGFAQAPPQTPTDPTDPPPSAAPATGPQSAQWSGMGIEDKLRYDGRHLFDFDNIVFAGIGAAFDQARSRPSEWGQGWGPFGERYGSHLGQYLIQRSIMFPVQAIDHEDTRFLRSKRTGYRGRLTDAFLHTVWRRSDEGDMMPAYSEFFGDYGAAAMSRLWWPRQYHKGSSIFLAGSDTMLIDAGINVFHEFAPDIKRWLRFGH